MILFGAFFNENTETWESCNSNMILQEDSIDDSIKKLCNDKELKVLMHITPIADKYKSKRITEVRQGDKVAYREFNLVSWLFGGMIYGNNYDKYIYSRIKIPKFSINYELQSSINVVNSKSYHIISSITIINPSMCDINTTTTLQEDYISKDISCKANLSNYTTNDINTHATISKVKTIRDINCKLYSIGLREYDIDCNIDVIEYPKPIIEIMKDISCKLTFGDKNITDISCSVILDPIYQFTKDILSNITVTLPNKNIRVAVIVDPYWTYDVFVFKSSLITLLSRTYRHCKLTLVYGGNTRSNSDIITIGKAFKVTNFEYIDFKYSYTDTKYNNLYYNHLIHELFSKPLDRLFIFTNKPSVNYYSPIFKLCTLCMHNNISSVVITSSGEYFELNQNCNFNHHNTDKPIVY